MTAALGNASAFEIAAAVKERSISAAEVTRSALARISALNPKLNCFTRVLTERAEAEAHAIDRKITLRQDPGPLAGVPFAVKDLFDVRGIPTLAGSTIRANAPAAQQDATAITSLNQAGAILVGTLNMDEFAYGFVTENHHYGPTHNPHDLQRSAGGSSGGSAAAVAAGITPLSLGTDTNGSIRVPASFCGVFGLKPTYGRLSREGAFLFAASLDTIGPFARTVKDLATAFDAMQGHDAADPVSTARGPEPVANQLDRGIQGLRIAIAGGYFVDVEAADANHAVAAIARALNVTDVVDLPDPARARAAAFIITAAEGGHHHLSDLRSQPGKFDPNTRTRLIAGALAPSAWVLYAQRFRSWYRLEMAKIFARVDVIIAPSTPCPAVHIGQKTIRWHGAEVPARANLGVFTQPVSFVGLPVLNVPVARPDKLPIGVQLIAAPYNEAALFRVAGLLEANRAVSAPVASI